MPLALCSRLSLRREARVAGHERGHVRVAAPLDPRLIYLELILYIGKRLYHFISSDGMDR